MRRAQQRMPVLSQFPTAYWLTGATLADRDVGLKQTTSTQWDNVYLNAEEIAVLVPAPKTLIADMDFDFWTEVKPRISEAIGLAVDEAVLFGVNKPATWPTAIAPAAVAAGNVTIAGTAGDKDFLGSLSNAMGMVEADGYDNTRILARTQVRAWTRNLRDSQNGFLMYPNSPPSGAQPQGSFFGTPVNFSRAGLSGFASGAAFFSAITGDFAREGIIATRDDITMEMFDQGIIQDAAGVIQFNLLQQDMVALRVTARFAFAVPNPTSRQNPTAGTRYPFAVVQQKASTGGEG